MSEPKVTKRTLADYKQHANNPNRHTERGLQIVEDSVNFNGAGRSGLAANDGTLLAGNGTWEAMERAGIQEVIEVETDGHQWVIVKRADLAPDDARAKALMASDNRASELGYSPDNELLGALLADIAAQDEHLLRGAGFTEGELQALLDGLQDVPADSGEQNGAQLRAKWQVEPGQLWQIGEHRLFCGDTLQESSRDILETPDEYTFFCDPFFEDKVIPTLHGLYDFTHSVFLTGGRQMREIINLLENFHEGVLLGCATRPQMGNHQVMMYEHKVLLYQSPTIHFEMGYSSVTRPEESAARQYGDVYHHTAKPVDAIEKILRPFQQTTIVDAFSGLGSTFVACERLRRRCLGIELDPAHCAGILERLSLMGLQPERVV